MKVAYPARKGQGWNLNPGLSDLEACKPVHCTASLGKMHVLFAQCPGGFPVPVPAVFPWAYPVPSTGSGVGKLCLTATGSLLPVFVGM